MRVVFAFLFLIYHLDVSAHGGNIATQSIAFFEDRIEMELRIDAAIIERYGEDLFGEDFHSKKGFFLSRYVNSNLTLTVEGVDIQFELLSVQQNEHVIVLKLEAATKVTKDSQIKLVSNLFYEVDEHFQNRVIFTSLEGNVTSYRMTNSRKELTI